MKESQIPTNDVGILPEGPKVRRSEGPKVRRTPLETPSETPSEGPSDKTTTIPPERDRVVLGVMGFEIQRERNLFQHDHLLTRDKCLVAIRGIGFEVVEIHAARQSGAIELHLVVASFLVTVH